MRWQKIGKAVNAEGTTITYHLTGTMYTVESRKRHIPHANREGTWDFTSYVVLHDGIVIATRYSLKDAREIAEIRSHFRGGEMTMIEINPSVAELVEQCGGYCPCAIEQNEDTLCPCKEFREGTDEVCHCGRYQKE